MHILMISDVYSPRVNGVSTSIATYRRDLLRRGHRVSLVAPGYGQPVAADDPDIHRIPGRNVPLDPEDRLMQRRHLRAALARFARASIDVVHVHTPFLAHYEGVRCARRLGVPCIETYHTLFEEYLPLYLPWVPKTWSRFVARAVTRRQAKQVDRLVVPSRAIRDRLAAYGVETACTILPTGLSEDSYGAADPARFRRRHGIEAHRPVVVHVGRLAFEKNIGFLLDVIDRLRRRIPDILMVIAGDGPARSHLTKICSERNLANHVRFVGYLARGEELRSCYASGAAFVFASKTETQGLVLLEAMACGVPVVSTAFMGTRDILECGRGALVAEDDVDDFSIRVEQVLRSPELRTELSEQASSYALEWRNDRFSERLETLYRNRADSGPGLM